MKEKIRQRVWGGGDDLQKIAQESPLYQGCAEGRTQEYRVSVEIKTQTEGRRQNKRLGKEKRADAVAGP